MSDERPGTTSTAVDEATASIGVGLSGRLLLAVGRPVLSVEQLLPAGVRRNFGVRIFLLAAASIVGAPALAVLLFNDVAVAATFIALVVAATGFLGYCEMYTAIIAFSRQVETVRDGEFDVSFGYDRPDELGRAFTGFEAMAGSLGETIEEVEAASETAEAERQRVTELLEGLETTADRYSRGMERAAAGDLTVRLDPDEESEAMARVAESFNDMIAELETTVTDIRRFAREVAEAGENVTARTDEVRTASEQVSDSVQEITAGADRQTEQLTAVAEEMEGLSGTIEEVASSADQVANTAQEAAELGRESRSSAAAAIEEMDTIERQAEAAVADVEALADEVAEIAEITDLIAGIAEQTNTLALNASIEAARAGEAGEGFAVVADEVKTLAEEAADGTDRIEAIVGDVQSSTSETVEEIREMGTEVADGTATVGAALADLEDVVEGIEDANRGIQEISEATTDQAASTGEVVEMVDDVTGVAERTSGEAGEVSAAAEQQTASLADVAESTESLTGRATDLRRRLDAFTLEADAGGDAGARPADPVAADGGPPPET